MSNLHRYLIDTNVISALSKAKPHGAVSAWHRSVATERMAIPAAIIGEIQEGVEIIRSQNQSKAQEIEAWLESVIEYYFMYTIDAAMFREWARQMIGTSDELSGDAMIAATARIHKLTVVTRNTKDLENFGVDLLNPFTHNSRVQPCTTPAGRGYFARNYPVRSSNPRRCKIER